jgi:hypothetical protein
MVQALQLELDTGRATVGRSGKMELISYDLGLLDSWQIIGRIHKRPLLMFSPISGADILRTHRNRNHSAFPQIDTFDLLIRTRLQLKSELDSRR